MRFGTGNKRPANAPRSGQSQMRQAFFARFAALAPLRSVRMAFLLFAVLQVVAPLWHVCEMGGRCGHCKEAGTTATGTAATDTASTGATAASAGVRLCVDKSCCKPKAYPAGTAFAAADTRPDRFSGTCLARELMGMGRVAVTPLTLDYVVTRVRLPRPADIPARDVPSLPFVPSRGPPLSL